MDTGGHAGSDTGTDAAADAEELREAAHALFHPGVAGSRTPECGLEGHGAGHTCRPAPGGLLWGGTEREELFRRLTEDPGPERPRPEAGTGCRDRTAPAPGPVRRPRPRRRAGSPSRGPRPWGGCWSR
ncbi:hypothetical protein GCM10010420_06520 [Streptomyces glaucosporus]|uniref:Uncharacterized protein n=1 Tax=Streptomyces glaucosporus TaxID=284044 RepID=A0ABP5URQ4_9ACTN